MTDPDTEVYTEGTMTTYKKSAIWGFLFGTVGLYVLAFLALILPFIESVGNFLFGPGRFLERTFTGPDGSTLEVVLLMIGNGIIYAIIFVLIDMARRKLR